MIPLAIAAWFFCGFFGSLYVERCIHRTYLATRFVPDAGNFMAACICGFIGPLTWLMGIDYIRAYWKVRKHNNRYWGE